MKPHGFLVYLSSELYIAIVKLQADKGLGRVYPVLYAINEGLFKLGYITEEVYEKYEERYSTPLVLEETKPLTVEQLREKEEIEKLNRHYSGVLKAWPTLREEIRKAHITNAKEVADKVPNAKFVLALANGKTVSLKATEKESSQ